MKRRTRVPGTSARAGEPVSVRALTMELLRRYSALPEGRLKSDEVEMHVEVFAGHGLTRANAEQFVRDVSAGAAIDSAAKAAIRRSARPVAR